MAIKTYGTMAVDWEQRIDFDRLRRCRVLPTSLLQANLDNFDLTGRFMRAESLARRLG